VLELLEKGANPAAKKVRTLHQTRNPIISSIQYYLLLVLLLLLLLPTPTPTFFSLPRQDGESAVSIACWEGHVGAIEALIAGGADAKDEVNTPKSFDSLPLHHFFI
jgi:hypothetical protein